MKAEKLWNKRVTINFRMFTYGFLGKWYRPLLSQVFFLLYQRFIFLCFDSFIGLEILFRSFFLSLCIKIKIKLIIFMDFFWLRLNNWITVGCALVFFFQKSFRVTKVSLWYPSWHICPCLGNNLLYWCVWGSWVSFFRGGMWIMRY